jgi:uracil-DNA glycosylase family 4
MQPEGPSSSRRRGSYRSLASLQRDNAACRACAEAGYRLESLPVIEGHVGQRAMLVGQAPGVREGEERRPWRGRAGQTLRRWLELEEEAFYATFYCAAITRCYPGRNLSGRGDRAPSREEIELCRFWREWEMRLLRPPLVVPVGGLAIRELLGPVPVTEAVGRRYPFAEGIAVPLPHPSGVSGWLNEPANRDRLGRALGVLREELASLDVRAVSQPA